MPNYAGCELCWTNVLVGDVYQLERHGKTVYVCAKCKTRLLMTNVIHFDGRTNEQKALHDPAGGLTTDAPEMTVGDSDSVSEHFTHEPCPDCNGSGINTDRWGICRNCNGEGMVLTAKPDDFAPSPTPSFR